MYKFSRNLLLYLFFVGFVFSAAFFTFIIHLLYRPNFLYFFFCIFRWTLAILETFTYFVRTPFFLGKGSLTTNWTARKNRDGKQIFYLIGIFGGAQMGPAKAAAEAATEEMVWVWKMLEICFFPRAVATGASYTSTLETGDYIHLRTLWGWLGFGWLPSTESIRILWYIK